MQKQMEEARSRTAKLLQGALGGIIAPHAAQGLISFSSVASGLGKAVYQAMQSAQGRMYNPALGGAAAAAAAIALKSAPEGFARGLAELGKIDVNKISGLSGGVALAALRLSELREDPSIVPAVRASFTGELAERMRDVLDSEAGSDVDVTPVEALLGRKVESLSTGRISAEGLATLLIALLSLFYTYRGFEYSAKSYELAEKQALNSDKASAIQAQQLERLLEVVNKAVEGIERLAPENDPHTYYVSERTVTVRDAPDNKAKAVTLLSPDTRVRLVQRKHKWVYVEYFDFLEGVPKFGWVNKKYLSIDSE